MTAAGSATTGFDATTLERLADLAVGFGANVQPGQIVAINAEIGKEEMVRALAASAYRHGARFVDPVYFDKAYYLAPDKGGAKPYALLTRALRESGRCAVGRYAARGKQYIVMLRPVDDGIVMQQLLNAEEVRSIKDIEIPETENVNTRLMTTKTSAMSMR